LGIVSAMRPELAALLERLEDKSTEEVAGRRLHRGRLHGHDVVMVLCGIGKVAAALTTTLLIERFGVRTLLFTGVAGGLGPHTQMGDVVVARSLLQHDMDASPLFPRHQIPDLLRDELPVDKDWSDRLADAAQEALAEQAASLRAFGLHKPQVRQGLVVSGDRFVSSQTESSELALRLPHALAVEMEGAAMAQVCTAYGVPCAMVRTISDRADDQAHVDFSRFLAEVASPMSREIISRALAVH
jgi:adenosylhomocysteine nucleosidase